MSETCTLEPMIVLNTPVTPAEPDVSATPKPRRPRVWTSFTTWILALVLGQVAVLAAVYVTKFGVDFVTGFQGGTMESAQQQFVQIVQDPLAACLLTIIPCQLGMAALLLFVAWRSSEPLKERLGLVPQSGRTYGKFRVATLACFTVASAFACNIASYMLIGPPPANDTISPAVANGSIWTITLVSIVLSVLPALMEESLFRGYMQRRFLKRWSPAVAITVSSLLFAVSHLDSVQHMMAVLPLGFVTGLLAYRTNSVKPGMLVHGLHNVAAVGAAALAPVVAAAYGPEALGIGLIGLIVVFGLIGLPMVVSLLRSRKSQPVIEAFVVPEPVVESLSVLKRELQLSTSSTDSRFASQAV